MFAEDPATCILGIQKRPDRKYKDTSRLIRESGEYVINLVDMDLAERMNITSINFEPEYDEFALAGLTPIASRLIAPPRIKESPVSFECKRTVTLQLTKERNLVVGEVLTMHTRDGLIDPESMTPEEWLNKNKKRTKR